MTNLVFLLLLFSNLFLTLYYALIRKEFLSPIFVFSFMWSLIFLFYFFNYEKWYDINLYTALVILIGNISFVLGTMFITANNNYKENYKDKSLLSLEKVVLNKKVIYILAIITIFSMGKTFIENITFLGSGMNFNDIIIYRTVNDTIIKNEIIFSFISIFVAKPFVFVSCILFGYEILVGKDKKLITLNLFIISMHIINGGKRTFILFMIIVIISCLLLMNKGASEKKRLNYYNKICNFIIMILLCICSFSIVIWLSQIRDTDFLKTLGSYFSGGIPSFNLKIDNSSSFYYGGGLFYGLLTPVFIGVKGVLNIPYPSWWENLVILVESAQYVSIGPNSMLNAFNTIYYIPYLDGGVLGIIIEMSLFGLFCGYKYKNMYVKFDLYSIFSYILILMGLSVCMYTFYITQYPYLLSFFYLYLLFKNKKNKIN